jgi:glycosyltransferase involved in cell wall biosynthesis
MKITVGIPAYNEEKNIAVIISKIRKITDSIIVCDDGSSDSTKDIAEQLGAAVVSHPRNLGYGAAIKTIFEKAEELDTDVLVTFDADGQHRVEDIERMVEPIKQNQADIVIGSRFLDSKESKVPSYRKFGIDVITKVTNATLKEKLTDSQSGFRAYVKNVLKELNLTDIGMGISTEILIKAAAKNFRICEIPITVLYADDSSTHNPVTHGTSVLISTIKYTSIEHPLKFYGVPSVVFLSIGLVFTYLAVQYYSDVGRLNTNLTIIAAGTVLIGVVLIITAVLLYSLVSVVRENNQS